MPEMDAGRIALGAHFTASFYTAYNHFETKLNLTNLRLIRSSRGISPLGFVVTANSDIKTVRRPQGQARRPGLYSGQPVIRVMTDAALAAYGISVR